MVKSPLTWVIYPLTQPQVANQQKKINRQTAIRWLRFDLPIQFHFFGEWLSKRWQRTGREGLERGRPLATGSPRPTSNCPHSSQQRRWRSWRWWSSHGSQSCSSCGRTKSRGLPPKSWARLVVMLHIWNYNSETRIWLCTSRIWSTD